MKTKISRIGKKSLSIVIALIMIVSTMLVGMVSVSATITGYSAIYFTPGSNWRQADAIFKLEADSNKIDFVCVDETNHIYKATLDSSKSYNNLKFLRINPTNTSDTWDYSNTFSWISNNKSLNHYTMKDELWKNWDVNSNNGTWGTYSGGSTSYSISKGTETNGTFSVSATSATAGSTVTVTTSPETGYEVDKVTYTANGSTQDASGSNNTYTFTMPAANVTVNVAFKKSPSTSYYIGGRFRVKDSAGTEHTTFSSGNWNPACVDENFKFQVDANNAGWYCLDTNLTVAELSADLTYNPYFLIHTGNGNASEWYGATSDTALHSFQNNNESNPADLQLNTDDLEKRYIKFSDTASTISGNVTLHFNPTQLKLYYTTEGDTPPGAYKLADKSGNFGKVVYTVNGSTVTTAKEGDEVTATVTPNNGFEYVANSFSVTNDATSEAVGAITGTSVTFTMPASNVTAKASFSVKKSEYVKTLADGLYVDVAPDKTDTIATFVMWNNYTGVGQDAPASLAEGYAAHNTKDYYTLYIPSNVDLSSVTLYNAFSTDVKINGKTIPADGSATVSLTETTYNQNSDNTYKVQVLKGSTSSMFLYTNDGKGNDYDLPTSKKHYTGLLDKDTVKASGGLCTTIKNGKVSDALVLSQVKGRGNSSWEASATLFGKYAFNMKLDSATELLGLPKSKSYCLLANNADDAMMRNAYIYQLAKDIGLYDSPEFEFVDIYDNGEYMGAYLITEKVDVASKNKLVKGNSIDDLNEDAGAKFDETNKKQGYADITNGVDLDNTATITVDGKDYNFKEYYQSKGTYLLEFEIDERYQDEISWFISNQGQHVVLKSPEFATKGEVEFIKEKFNAMEALVYPKTGSIDLEALSKVMDLDSFARMYLIQEFSANLDSAATSFYITYDCSKGLFVASPVWDYDWALGQNNGSKKSVSGSDLYSKDATKMFAMDKAMGKGDATGKYSLQSKLATDSNFKTVIKKVWLGKNNDGFYNKAQEYYTKDGWLDTWRDQITASVNMNEERWGFIANNPLRGSAWNYASTNTTNFNNKTGFEGAVEFLKGTNNAGWSKNRVDNLLNGVFTGYNDYEQIATPTLTAYASDGTTPLTGEVGAGGSYVLKASTSEIYVDYVLYDGDEVVATNSDGVFAIENAVTGTHNYKVETVYNTTNKKSSTDVTVTVSSVPADIESVTISASKTEVSVNETFTLTAEVAPVGLSGVTYTYYMNNAPINGATDITSNTYQVRIASAGSATFKVAATANGKTVTSSSVTVTATKVDNVHNLKVYFKCPSAPAYKPSVSIDGKAPVAMTQGTELGKNYSGTLTFYWYYADLGEINSADVHTVTFTSKRTKLNATMEDIFADTEYYLAVDDLMSGTEVVDLTEFSGDAEKEHILNFYHSATNTVYSGVGTDKTLGFTNIDGTRYKMGTLVDNNGVATFSIRSATAMQMLSAQLTTVSKTQQALLDVNLDGRVDVKDATLMQRALVS